LPGEDAPPLVGEVRDESDTLTGYWVQQIGFVERSVVEAPGFDPVALASEYKDAQKTREGQRRITGTPEK
jgi:hypothetical protein